MQHVFGYAVMNDVTSRELQKRHGRWVIGKGIDTFARWVRGW
ncbi:MAG: fumarylacetoacetate hydrolase family protein [Burkholderiaceae bacterium]